MALTWTNVPHKVSDPMVAKNERWTDGGAGEIPADGPNFPSAPAQISETLAPPQPRVIVQKNYFFPRSIVTIAIAALVVSLATAAYALAESADTRNQLRDLIRAIEADGAARAD